MSDERDHDEERPLDAVDRRVALIIYDGVARAYGYGPYRQRTDDDEDEET